MLISNQLKKLLKNPCEKKTKKFWKKRGSDFLFWVSILQFFNAFESCIENVFYKCGIEFHFASISGPGGSIFFF